MRTGIIAMTATLSLSFSFGGNAAAEVASRGTASAGADIILSGTIMSTIAISVNGSVNAGSSATTIIAGSGATGTIGFGETGSAAAVNGEKFRVIGSNGRSGGVYLVATVTVAAVYSGFGSAKAALDIARAAPCSGPPDIPCGMGALLFAKPALSGSVAWPAWTEYPDQRLGTSVFEIPDASYVPGAGNLASGVSSNEAVDHQLAVWIPDDASAGPFMTVIRYTATRM